MSSFPLRRRRCRVAVTAPRPIVRFGVVDRSPSFHVVEGTPADCVRVALHRFAGELDWVLSGVNDGGNLGVDVYHSGTVAAVREAGLRGVPGIAISHYHNRPLVGDDWKRAARWGKPLVRQLMARAWIKGTYWNINFPSLDPGADDPQVVFCPLDPVTSSTGLQTGRRNVSLQRAIFSPRASAGNRCRRLLRRRDLRDPGLDHGAKPLRR